MELSTSLQVIGIDYSGRLIDAALQFQEKREVEWGSGEDRWTLALPDEMQFNSVNFKQVRNGVSDSQLVHPPSCRWPGSRMSLRVQISFCLNSLTCSWNRKVFCREINSALLTYLSLSLISPSLPLSFLTSSPPPQGWLMKLWECVASRGMVVFSASDQWNAQTIQEYIGKW